MLAQIHNFMFCYFIVITCHNYFRNIAFLRYPDEPDSSLRLRDLGYEIVPSIDIISKDWEKRRDVDNWPKNWLERSFWFVISTPMVYNKRGSERPHTINMALRMYEIMSLGSMMRFTVYVGTTLPGANDSCFGPWANYSCPKPQTFADVWTREGSSHWHSVHFKSSNCGDLVFSGHVYMSCTLTILIWMYCRDVFQITEK